MLYSALESVRQSFDYTRRNVDPTVEFRPDSEDSRRAISGDVTSAVQLGDDWYVLLSSVNCDDSAFNQLLSKYRLLLQGVAARMQTQVEDSQVRPRTALLENCGSIMTEAIEEVDKMLDTARTGGFMDIK
jgi:hypothetical protein